MAAPGDPQTPDDHDDLIGFTSPSSLTGVERPARPVPAPEPVHQAPYAAPDDHGDDLFDDPPRAAYRTPAPEPRALPDAPAEVDPDDLGPLFSDSAPSVAPAPPSTPASPSLLANMDFEAPLAPVAPATSALPAWARETVRPPKPAAARPPRAETPEGAMGLYTVYALILFAVPTLGVSALIALLAISSRTRPDQPLARSHFQFQKRTLWIAAVGAVLGVVLIAVNLGVFVLFAMALWVLVRGAVGVVRLASGRPVANPNTLFI